MKLQFSKKRGHGVVTTRVYNAILDYVHDGFTIQDIVGATKESDRSIRSVIIRLTSSGILEKTGKQRPTDKPGPNLMVYKVKDAEYLNNFIKQINLTNGGILSVMGRSEEDLKRAAEYMNEVVEQGIYETDPQSGIAQLRPLIKIFADFGTTEADEYLIKASRLIETCRYYGNLRQLSPLEEEQRRQYTVEWLQEQCHYALQKVEEALDLLLHGEKTVESSQWALYNSATRPLSLVLEEYKTTVLSDPTGHPYGPEGYLLGPTVRHIIKRIQLSSSVSEEKGGTIFQKIVDYKKVNVCIESDIPTKFSRYNPIFPHWLDAGDLAVVVEDIVPIFEEEGRAA